jgi:hypothetical protein
MNEHSVDVHMEYLAKQTMSKVNKIERFDII